MKNLFTTDNAAMLLIDHQRGTIKLARNIDHAILVANTRALARTAVETGMQLVLTSSQEDHFQGLLLDDIREIAPDAYNERVKRPGVVDCWLFEPFKKAVENTKKKKLIMADDAARERMRMAGVTITSTNQVMAELATDWANTKGGIIQKIMYEEILKNLIEMP